MVLVSPSKGNSFARRSSLVPLPPEMRWHVTWSCLTYLALCLCHLKVMGDRIMLSFLVWCLCHLKVMGDRIMLSRNISGLVPLPPESHGWHNHVFPKYFWSGAFATLIESDVTGQRHTKAYERHLLSDDFEPSMLMVMQKNCRVTRLRTSFAKRG